jgi:peptidyl-prolyl cis-trans isomerase A (cyclophilin A)/peptidyl-prolyl cis-trans isomerase B (cyclophilin B)
MKLRVVLSITAMLLSLNAWAANLQVEMKTNVGNVIFELYPDKAPQTVHNFMEYVKTGFYKGTVFHRVINKFVVQGGGLTPELQPKPTLAPINNEAANGLTNERGTLAMARAYDPNSATAQFFVNLDSNKFLNHYKPEPDYYGYCVFGKVIKGMDVMDKIAARPTGAAGPFQSDVPLEPIIIEDVSLLKQVAEAKKSLNKSRKKRNVHG